MYVHQTKRNSCTRWQNENYTLATWKYIYQNCCNSILKWIQINYNHNNMYLCELRWSAHPFYLRLLVTTVIFIFRSLAIVCVFVFDVIFSFSRFSVFFIFFLGSLVCRSCQWENKMQIQFDECDGKYLRVLCMCVCARVYWCSFRVAAEHGGEQCTCVEARAQKLFNNGTVVFIECTQKTLWKHIQHFIHFAIVLLLMLLLLFFLDSLSLVGFQMILFAFTVKCMCAFCVWPW